MPLHSWQYPLYVPPSHLEDLKVKYHTTTQTITLVTEPHINKRFLFAESSFARIFSVPHVTEKMREFCYDWAQGTDNAPLESLREVDIYFEKLWNQNSLS